MDLWVKELIPFKNEQDANKFKDEHFGEKSQEKFEEIKKIYFLESQCDFIALSII